MGAQPHNRSAIGGTSENRFGMSGREASQHGGSEFEGAAEHGDRLASTLCGGRDSGIAGPSAIGQTAAIHRGVSQASAGHAGKAPPQGQAVWDGPALAEYLKTSVHAVWRVLRKEGICLARQRSWCVSTDPEFTAKAADVVGLYLNPPQNALVLSVDEKPSIQALERKTGFVETDSGKIVRGFKRTYKRHGTLNLFAALEVATGAVHTQTTGKKRRIEFLEFMDRVVADLPVGKEIHAILDNYCIHKKNDAWLAAHPNVFFHFTPTSASWLNQVEVWFGILSRKALRGASFRDIEQLRKAIEDFVAAYGPKAKPFVWRKREVKGSQLRNTIVNLRN